MHSQVASDGGSDRNFPSETTAREKFCFSNGFAATSQQGTETHQQFLAEAEWWAAVGALGPFMQATLPTSAAPDSAGVMSFDGVVLSGPLPVVQDQTLMQRLSTWIFIPHMLEGMLAVAQPLLPAHRDKTRARRIDPLQTVPLSAADGLLQERFCLVMTPHYSLSLLLGSDGAGLPEFRFCFEPEVNQGILAMLRSRVSQARLPLLSQFDSLTQQFPWVEPDYRLVSRFSRLLMGQIQQQRHSQLVSSPSAWASSGVANASSHNRVKPAVYIESAGVADTPVQESTTGNASAPDAELLKAMAHEIRTPLTTIRTFTRSLLRRQDLAEDVLRRLQLIDRECTQQIDRFNLIFTAVELENAKWQPAKSPLAPISLTQIFQDSIPQWQQQASRRNLELEVKLPSQMPMVTSDPTMLSQVLTGLVERFTQSLPAQSHIELAVTLAGHQLKLQFQSHLQGEAATSTNGTCAIANGQSPLKSLGQLLMFQPETGGLSLNLNATKNLFQALGGKLIVKQKPQQGEVLTVFLPLETRTL